MAKKAKGKLVKLSDDEIDAWLAQHRSGVAKKAEPNAEPEVKAKPVKFGISDGEIQAWLKILRSDRPVVQLSRGARLELADILERLHRREGGKMFDTPWTRANKDLKTIFYRHEVDQEIAKGMPRAKAIKIVAERYKLKKPGGLRQRIAKPRV